MNEKIKKIENTYYNKKTKNRLNLLASNYYLAFLNTDDIKYLKNGYEVLYDYLQINKTDLDIIMLISFFLLQLKENRLAKKYLNAIDKYKKNLKINQPIKYSFYVYLIALEKFNNKKNITKYIKILHTINKQNNHFINLLIINLKLETGCLDRNIIADFNPKQKYIIFTNLTLFKIFEKTFKFLKFDKQIFNNYTKWAYKNNLNIEKSLYNYQIYLSFKPENYYFNKNFYIKYKYDFILEKITQLYIENNQISENTFFFYKEAIKRQIILENLVFYYIKGCYMFNIKDIGLYPLKSFLQKKELDFDIIAFVYCIIINNKKYNEVLEIYKEIILKYALYFLEKDFKGIYYYNLYKYLLDNIKNNQDLENKILKIIYPIYYKYELYIKNKSAKYIFIKDLEINTIKEYEILQNKVYIDSISGDFSYYLFDETKKELLNSEIIIKKFIQDNSTKISLKFYLKGYINDFVLINLGKYFLKTNKIDKTFLPILLDILNIQYLDKHFKIKILQLIANIYYLKENFQKATYYFKQIPENQIDYKYIDNLLMSYVYSLEFEKAIQIIIKNSHIISDETLYIVLRSVSEDDKNDEILAPFIYEMLMKSKIDNLFIEIVLKYYKGSLSEWIELRKVLANNDIFNKNLDEKILKLTIYTHNLNPHSEKVFQKLFHFDIQNIILEEFLDYCIYESIFNKYIFSETTIKIMEHIFMDYEYEDLGYCLAHIYFNQNINLNDKEKIFDKIIFNLEKANINFPIFEQNKDKLKKYPYIFKNTPFIFKDIPNKNIFLFYKEINETTYKSLEMKYFKFGIYICTIPTFFGEEIEFYFAQDNKTDKILTEKNIFINNYDKIIDFEDEYFKLNNGIIYMYQSKFENIEDFIANNIKQNIFKQIL